MIGKLKGTIDEIGEDHVIVDVHGVGYVAFCSARTLGNLLGPGEAVVLHIETYVREDMIRLYGFDFLHSAASARVLNVATNAGALVWFGSQLELLWLLAILMAVANVSGAVVGTGLALKHGSGFVRRIFVGVVLALIARTAWQAYFGA